MNPLLDISGLPRFAEIKSEHVTPAIEQLLANNRAVVSTLTADTSAPTWQTFVLPLEDSNEHLSRAWSQVSHMNSVVNSPELREVYNANLSKITEYYAELSQNLKLYDRYKAIKTSPEFAQLSAAQKKIIDNELRDFRLGGAELPEDQKIRFKAIQEELATLSARFEENLLDTTNAYAKYVEHEAELKGLPADVLQAAQEAASADGKPGWKFTLHAPSYMPVMQYAEHRPLREALYRAYVTRASEFGKAEWDNTPLIGQILALRQEAAHLIGYKSYAEVSLATKMAATPDEVMDFLNSLGQRAKPFAQKDLAEVRAFAAENFGMPELEAWDIGYYSEKLREARYGFSDEEVKQYFPESTVLPGMFKLVETIYGLKIHETHAPTWHADVRFFSITDHTGQLVGQFYLDLYARKNKRGGAWMDDAITRRRKQESIQTPVAYLTCNFSAPVGGKPALFTHDEVITLFHEFGHGLHHLLTKIEDLGVSGINGVEWDAVELPSQFMENFCWEWDVVRHMSRHVDTGESLPRALYDKMLQAKNFQSGLFTMRQIEFALFDMRLHDEFDPKGARSVLQLLEEVREQVAVIRPPAFNRFPNNFSHIFAGGYAAGYYSYKWAEVLSADAYSLFEENGVLSAEVGHRFWSEILGQGGSRPALESFVAFRGREPTLDALLRHSGMVEA
ncbi:MAG: M3 family metallopeptidase [Burkholderiales bacterium]|nr:M3 family metallopeptidase [Burkholderiales bacterium]